MNTQVFLNAVPEIVTQLIAFVLVFLVLKKFAFGAIFKGIEDRQKSIADQFKDAENRKASLAALEQEYRAKIQNIDQEAREKIQSAIAEGNRISQDLREKARQEAAREMDRARAEAQQELLKAKAALRTQVVNLASKMASKIVHKNLTAKDDEAYVEEVLREAEKA